MSHLLTDEAYIKELAKIDRTTLQRIYDAIVDFFEKIIFRYSEDASPRETEFKDALKELQGEFNTIKAMYENALKETTNVQQSEIMLPKSGDGANVINSKEGVGKNGDDKWAEASQDDYRYSKLQAGEQKRTISERGNTKGDNGSRRTGVIRRGNRNIEKSSLEDIIENKNFIEISHFIGNGVSADIRNYLFKKYRYDKRCEVFDFSEMIAYDMLSDENNELRRLFPDEINWYFNNGALPKNQDTAGEIVSDDVLEKTKGTVIANESSNLIPILSFISI